MKRIVLGSLLSCMLIGQVFCANKQWFSTSFKKGFVQGCIANSTLAVPLLAAVMGDKSPVAMKSAIGIGLSGPLFNLVSGACRVCLVNFGGYRYSMYREDSMYRKELFDYADGQLVSLSTFAVLGLTSCAIFGSFKQVR